MIRFIFKRFGQSLIVALFVSALVFVGMYVISDPVTTFLPDFATQEDIDNFIKAHGLDKSLFEQYTAFLANLLEGNFGTSLKYNEPVLDLILERLPATLEAAVLALLLALLIGIPAGIYSGLKPKSVGAKVVGFFTTVGYSIPNFWQGIVLIMFFAVMLQILPAGGRGETAELFGVEWSFLTPNGLLHLILPVINLAIYKICMQTRLSFSGTREVLTQEYIIFAKSKGISRSRLVRRHVLMNILIPIVTITGLEFGTLLAYSTVSETIFSYPGIGKLLLDSIKLGDSPVVVAYLILIALLFVFINFVVDVIYALIDPRIRYQ